MVERGGGGRACDLEVESKRELKFWERAALAENTDLWRQSCSLGKSGFGVVAYDGGDVGDSMYRGNFIFEKLRLGCFFRVVLLVICSSFIGFHLQ